DVRAARGEVLAQDPQAASYLEDDVVLRQLRRAVDDAEDVRVDEEVLAEIALGAHPEAPHPAERRLGREVVRRVAGRRRRHRAHPPTSSAALRSTICSSWS